MYYRRKHDNLQVVKQIYFGTKKTFVKHFSKKQKIDHFKGRLKGHHFSTAQQILIIFGQQIFQFV